MEYISRQILCWHLWVVAIKYMVRVTYVSLYLAESSATMPVAAPPAFLVLGLFFVGCKGVKQISLVYFVRNVPC